MLMDLTCPVEFRQMEMLRDSSGRIQVYLTFFSQCQEEVDELDAVLHLLDKQGVQRGIKTLHYRGLHAQPFAPFTLSLTLDDYTYFSSVRVLITRLTFALDAPWQYDRDALVDCTPPPLPLGPERTALIAIAGGDAQCFPQRRNDMWICVCGRFNKRAWRLCRRCQRHRDAVLTQYTKENTLAQYEAVKADLRAKELAQIEEEKQRAASLARQRKNTFLNQTHLLQTKRRNRFLLVLGTLLLCVGAMLLYLYLK